MKKQSKKLEDAQQRLSDRVAAHLAGVSYEYYVSVNTELKTVKNDEGKVQK